jgi:hypothetical protein
LSRLSAVYPSDWQPTVEHHVYVDNGGIYSAVDSAFWLRGKVAPLFLLLLDRPHSLSFLSIDKDHILVTTRSDVSKIPDIDLNAGK